MMNKRDQWIAEQRKDIKKVQCPVCFHWVYPGNYNRRQECCEGCAEEEDQEPYLWSQWRSDRGV